MMLKKSISLLLAIVMTFSLAVTAFATEVDDTQAGSNLTLAKKAQSRKMYLRIPRTPLSNYRLMNCSTPPLLLKRMKL